MHIHSVGAVLLLATSLSFTLPLRNFIFLTTSVVGSRLKLPSTVAPLGRRQSSGNATAHHQVYCHNESQPSIYTIQAGDPDNGGAGILITNFDNNTHGVIPGSMYFLYENNHDFIPYKFTIIPPWRSAFISVCPSFEGRIVRGDWSNLNGKKHLLGTWAEVDFNENGSSWGDISVLQGNDGAAIIQSLDGRNNMKGFTADLLAEAPVGAWAQKQSGSWCLDMIAGVHGNNITKQWEMRFLDPWSVYVEDNINPVINTNNARFMVTFYNGVV